MTWKTSQTSFLPFQPNRPNRITNNIDHKSCLSNITSWMSLTLYMSWTRSEMTWLTFTRKYKFLTLSLRFAIDSLGCNKCSLGRSVEHPCRLEKNMADLVLVYLISIITKNRYRYRNFEHGEEFLQRLYYPEAHIRIKFSAAKLKALQANQLELHTF